MQIIERKITVLNLLQRQPVREESFELGPIRFTVLEHSIGWDFEAAEEIIKIYDGYSDGFALVGVPRHLGVGKQRLRNPGYVRLIRAATKSSIYVADDLRDFFSDWTMKRILEEQPQLFFGKKVLFHCASIASILPKIKESGGIILAADPLLVFGIPLLLRGSKGLSSFFELGRAAIRLGLFKWINPTNAAKKGPNSKTLAEWMTECDILVGYGAMLSGLDSYQPLSGKIVIVDDVDQKTRARLEKAGVAQIIECVPEQKPISLPSFNNFPVLAAVIDQTRILEESDLDFSDYFLKWLERTQLGPRSLKSSKGMKRKCAFIIHALTQEDLWKVPAIRFLRNSPTGFRQVLEKGASYLPCFYMGRLTGAMSEATGQEVDCDFYALAATTRHVVGMREEFLYNRLVQCAELAQARGAGIIGLGAYTKVVGDGGVTVARRSPIPVTNGNSYSASTTLWAARQVVESLGMISPERIGSRFKAKAMIIGATGSIGRVSALLMSLVFQEIILVANRADKLLELRDEILKLSPGIHVGVTTHSHTEITDVDLIVTATSNQTGSVLDMNLVKPGAVICDCSRPLDIKREDAAKRPDVLVIESGEVILPGNLHLNLDIGLPPPSVYACTAETVLLAMEGRFESFSLSKHLSLEKTKEIYKLGVKHGAKLSSIQGPCGLITVERIAECRTLALQKLPQWNALKPGLTFARRQGRVNTKASQVSL